MKFFYTKTSLRVLYKIFILNVTYVTLYLQIKYITLYPSEIHKYQNFYMVLVYVNSIIDDDVTLNFKIQNIHIYYMYLIH